jgi:iron uptake system component EfeO
LTGQGCDPTTLSAPAGVVSFAVTNKSDDKGEFEIVSAAPKIVTEKFLDARASQNVDVTLTSGDYDVICGAPSNTRAKLTITGTGGETAAPKVDQTKLASAVAAYTTYVDDQVEKLVTGTGQLVGAVKAGDVAKAKELYAPVRAPWERIEPVAELFPDSDAAIDSRVDDFDGPDDPAFTGFHRLEEGLWVEGSTANLGSFADRLETDVDALAKNVRGVKITPDVMVNGAAGLIEEAAQTKITGEEERYSHTDLVTFAANVEGAKVIYDGISDLLKSADPSLDRAVAARFAVVDEILAPYKQGDTYASYDKLDDAARDRLKAAMAGLSEELSEVAGALGLEVK